MSLLLHLAALYCNVESGEPVPGARVHALPLFDERVDHADVTLAGRRVDAPGTKPVRHQQRDLNKNNVRLVYQIKPNCFVRYAQASESLTISI